MVQFEPLNMFEPEQLEMLQQGFDRVLCLEADEMHLLKLAARARNAYRKSSGEEPLLHDLEFEKYPDGTDRLYSNREYTSLYAGMFALLQGEHSEYTGVSDRGQINRIKQRAAELAAEYKQTSQEFEKRREAELDALFKK